MSYPEFEKFNLEAGEILTREQLNALREAFDFAYLQGTKVAGEKIAHLTAERDYYKERCEAAEKLVDVWIDQPPFGTGYDLDRWRLWKRERLQPQTKILSELKSKQP